MSRGAVQGQIHNAMMNDALRAVRQPSRSTAPSSAAVPVPGTSPRVRFRLPKIQSGGHRLNSVFFGRNQKASQGLGSRHLPKFTQLPTCCCI